MSSSPHPVLKVNPPSHSRSLAGRGRRHSLKSRPHFSLRVLDFMLLLLSRALLQGGLRGFVVLLCTGEPRR